MNTQLMLRGLVRQRCELVADRRTAERLGDDALVTLCATEEERIADAIHYLHVRIARLSNTR